MSVSVSVFVCVAVNIKSCYIWIVNDITDFNTCFFSVSPFFSSLLYFRMKCVRRGVCVCVAVNSHTCCVWIVNDITDSNTCFLFQFFSFFYCILEEYV